jgi:hypothetical protein
MWEVLRFVALTHDLGKAWSRTHHQRATLAALKAAIPIQLHPVDAFRLIGRSHTHGNPTKMEWLVKGADRLAAQIQRNDSDEPTSPILTADRYLQRMLMADLRDHFAKNALNVNSLRFFIEGNQVLEIISADDRDTDRSSLRQHLLLTEQILNLLLALSTESPLPKHLDGWVKTKRVLTYVTNHIKPIPPLRVTIKPQPKPLLDRTVRSYLENACRNGYTDEKIAFELGLTREEVRALKTSTTA